MRGVSTAPIVFAIITIAVAAGVQLLQWYYAQMKASQLEAQWAQDVARYKAMCLSAVTTGSNVVVGQYVGPNYTGPNCFVSTNMVIVVDLSNSTSWSP
ncbi:MAG: hypothetical protein QXU93_08020 [Thermoproteus sp.]